MHPATAAVLASLAEMKLEQRRYTAAEPLVREALTIEEKAAPGSWRQYYAQAMLGAALAASGHTADARPLLTSAYAALVAKKNSIPSDKQNVLESVRRWQSQLP
jgi:hypothetical protein